MKTSSFIKRFQGTEMVAIYYFCDGDESTSSDDMDVDQIVDAIRSYNRETINVWGKAHPELFQHLIPLKNIQSREDLLKRLNCDVLENAIAVIPKAQWDKERSEAKRVEIEGLAASICRRHNCDVDSIEFMGALQAEREKASNYQHGLEEDGPCATGYGIHSPYVATLEWGEESQGCVEDIGRIEDWIESNLPLLSAKWRSAGIEQVKELT